MRRRACYAFLTIDRAIALQCDTFRESDAVPSVLMTRTKSRAAPQAIQPRRPTQLKYSPVMKSV